MFQYVALVSGTTIVDLTALPYALVSYGMQVAPLNDNELGLLYADVEESMTIHVTGFTVAETYANINAVNALLDQARRWRYGEPVDVVLLRVQAQDSSTPLDVALLGRPPGGDNPTTLPPTWDNTIGRYLIHDVALSFVRHGQWLNPTTESGSSTSATNPTVQSITIASTITRSSPVKLACQFQTGGVATPGILDAGVVLVSSGVNHMQISEAEAGVLGTNIASVADVANRARGAAVARYSPGVLSSSLQIAVSPVLDVNSQRFAFYAAVRNNSATTTWTIQVTAGVSKTVITPIDASTLNPRIVFLGFLTMGEYVALGTPGFAFYNVLLTASAASGTLDIDYLVAQVVDDETSAAIGVFDPDAALGTGLTAAGVPLTIDHRLLTDPSAVITSLQSAGLGILVPVPYAGNPIVYSRGSLVVTILGTDAGLWRVCDGTTVLDTVWTATRTPAFLVPE